MILIIIIRKRYHIEYHSQNENDNENHYQNEIDIENHYQNEIDIENHYQQVCLQESCQKILDITLIELCYARSMPKNT